MNNGRKAWVFARYCDEDSGNTTIQNQHHNNICHPLEVRVFEGTKPPEDIQWQALVACVDMEQVGSKTGSQLIADERQRHFDEEGWTQASDAQYVDAELLRASISYIASVLPSRWGMVIGWMWPFGARWWKADKHSVVHRLAIAGSLVAAEIDRLRPRGEGDPR